ncbi:insulinase family protein [Rhodobacteraceae bacterium NNCM2]|nr:insulinase family protein [Coraliihabitans acroporae]
MSFFARISTTIAAALIALPAWAVDIQEVTSPGGITFWMVEEPSIPIVSIDIKFDGGARLDPEGQEGLAGMMAALLDEGAGDLDAVAFSNARDELSARFGFGGGMDAITVNAQMLVETMTPASELLATALANPRFEPEAVERVRAQIMSGLAEDETDPGAIARKDWYARAFPDHPYGRTSTRETISGIIRDDLVASVPRLINRANATVALVGAVNAEQAGALVDTIFDGIEDGEKLEEDWVEMSAPPGVNVIDLDVPQSTAIFGHAGLKRTDPDFIPAYVMNYILGGGSFNSRLTEEVREKRGLAYSVYSYMRDLDESALYVGSVQTANQSMGESLELIRGEWERMAADGLSESDLDRAKKYLTGAFPLRFDSNAKIAAYLVFMQTEDLGIDYLETRNQMIEAVTLEDAKRAAARVLQPDALAITVVGRPEGVEATQE